MPTSRNVRDIAIEFLAPQECVDCENAKARRAITELACALARMAAQEDDATGCGL